MHTTPRAALRTVGALGLGAVLVAATMPAAAAHPWETPQRPHFTLTVLHGQDPESHILGAGDEPEDFGGVARYMTLLNKLEKLERHPRVGGHDEAPRRGVVKVNAGDMFLAGAEFSASLEEDNPFYEALALHYADYDAIAIGNHEWDFGPDLFAEFIEESPEGTPWLSSNLDVTPEPALAALAEKDRIAPSTVVRERGQEIGIIGATTDRLHSISSPGEVVVDPDYASTIQAEADRLAGEGVDIVIVVSHLQGIINDKILGRELSGVDLLISGGGHEPHARPGAALVPGDEIGTDPETGQPLEYPLWVTDADGEEVPIFAAGSDYKYVGKVVANFDRDGDLINIADRSDTQRVSGAGADAVKEHPKVLREITEPVREHLAGLADEVVAQSDVGLDGRREFVRTQETNLGNLLADAQLAAARNAAQDMGVPEPQVALQNGGGIRNDSVITDQVTALETHNVAAFHNQVSIVPDIPREHLRQLYERGVSGVPVEEGRFAQVGGLSLVYDAAMQPQELDADGEIAVPGERIRELVLDDGTVIVEDGEVVAGEPVTMATIDFLAGGGDAYPFGGLDYEIVPGTTYQIALLQYLRDDLAGHVTAEDYPEGGEGRIVAVDQ